MPNKNRVGYDTIETYEEHEIEKMFLDEGMSPKEAHSKAIELTKAIKNMYQKERRFWNSVRANEMCVGLEPLYIEEMSE